MSVSLRLHKPAVYSLDVTGKILEILGAQGPQKVHQLAAACAGSDMMPFLESMEKLKKDNTVILHEGSHKAACLLP